MMLFQYLVIGVSIGCVYGLVAIGLVITFKGARFFNFAHGEYYMLGAILTFAFTAKGLSIFVAAVLAGLGVAILALIVERAVFRRFVVAGTAPINAIIASLGLASLIRGLAIAVWGPAPKNVPSLVEGPPISIYGSLLPRDLAVVMGVTVFASACFFLLLKLTRIGVAMRATADRLHLVGLFGIDIRMILPLIFVISGFLGGVAGATISPFLKAQATMGMPVLIKAFAAAILGGLENPWGALMGGIGLGIAESLSARYISSSWSDVISYSIVLVVLVLRPQGLLGKSQTAKV